MCQIGVNTFMQKYVCAVHETVRVRNDMRWLYKVIIAEAETGGGVGLHVSKAQEFNKGFIAFNLRTGLRAFIWISFLSAAPHI